MMYPEGLFMGIPFNPLPTVLVLRNYENYFTTSLLWQYCFFSSKKFSFSFSHCGKKIKEDNMFGTILAKH